MDLLGLRTAIHTQSSYGLPAWRTVHYSPRVVRILLRFLLNLLRMLFLPLFALQSWRARRSRAWMKLSIGPRVVERERPMRRRDRWVRQAMGTQIPRTTELDGLRKLAERLSGLRAGEGPKGILLVVSELQAGWATVYSLRDAVANLREGRNVTVFFPRTAGLKELFVASAADRVISTPEATVALTGLGRESWYVKGALDKLGVGLEVVAHGRFKTALENMYRTEMSDAQREQTALILDAVMQAVRSALVGRGGQTAENLQTALDEGLLTGGRAKELQLIDACMYEDVLRKELLENDDATFADATEFFAATEPLTKRVWSALAREPVLAFVPVTGTIREAGDAASSIAVLRAVRKDKYVKGVLLYVNSPGGSALVSDLIHREVARAASEKPVVAFFADVAASGGYYVATAANKIVCAPLGITGSIGVFTAKPNIGGALERWEVNVERSAGVPASGLFSLSQPLSEQDRGRLSRYVDASYERFLQVVAEGRKLSRQEADDRASGRVWTAEDALTQRLVDEIGDVTVAETALRQLAWGKAGARGPLPLRSTLPGRLVRDSESLRAGLISLLADGLRAHCKAELEDVQYAAPELERWM